MKVIKLVPLLATCIMTACAAVPVDETKQSYSGLFTLVLPHSSMFQNADGSIYELRLVTPAAQQAFAAAKGQRSEEMTICIKMEFFGRADGTKNEVDRPILLVEEPVEFEKVACVANRGINAVPQKTP